MKQERVVVIDTDNNLCGIDCRFKRSLAQFNMHCLLYNEDLKYKKSESINNILYFRYDRLFSCTLKDKR